MLEKSTFKITVSLPIELDVITDNSFAEEVHAAVEQYIASKFLNKLPDDPRIKLGQVKYIRDGIKGEAVDEGLVASKFFTYPKFFSKEFK